MDLKLLLGLFICVFSLQGLVLGRDTQKSGDQLSINNLYDSTRSGHTVKFLLYNRQRLTNPELLQVSTRRGLFTSFINNKPLKVIIHGWKGGNEKRFCTKFREAFLANQDVNIIIVDWSDNGSKNWLYPMSRQKVPEVAKAVAEFLDNLSRQHGVRLERVHILGHSLGAHIAGLAGYKVKAGKIGRITALDPAGPLFSPKKPDERLSQNSALFVDVIHTCGKFLGMEDPIGHADFFPNSGNFIQPGCGIDIAGSCSHRRAYFFYLESISNQRAFPAVTCPGWKEFKGNKQSCNLGGVVYMGEGLSTSARGVYYLTTNGDTPFGLGRV